MKNVKKRLAILKASKQFATPSSPPTFVKSARAAKERRALDRATVASDRPGGGGSVSQFADEAAAAVTRANKERRSSPHSMRGDDDGDDDPPSSKPLRLIDKVEVLKRVPVSFPTLWTWMRRGDFPLSRNMGGKVAWVEAEVDAWIAARPVNPIKPLTEKVDS